MLDMVRGAHQRLAKMGALRVLAFGLAMLATLSVTGIASASGFTLPDPGVDVAGAVTATITALGAIVLVVVGGYFAYLLIRKGLQWSRRAFG